MLSKINISFSLCLLASINPPTNITAVSTGTSTIRLTWNPSTSPVLGYYVFIKPLDQQTVGNTTVILCPNVTIYELQGLTAMTEYLVKVDAVDDKEIGTTGQDLTVKTDEEGTINAAFSLFHSFFHSFICSFVCSFVRSFLCSFLPSFIHSYFLCFILS